MSNAAGLEVAADFREALQDLRTTTRPEISTLTVIAKENTEYAEAISKVLEEHIQKTRPEWKLPALYVLDSIVKNVGTPYTLYLSRNLAKTFIDAFLVVDQNTRKSMESLARTWKQPVPESLDARPVFRPEVTQDIDSTLDKFRTAMLQHQQQQSRSSTVPTPTVLQQQHLTQWRNTPTPPQSGWQMPVNGQTHLPTPLIASPLRNFATPVSLSGQYAHSQPQSLLQQSQHRNAPDLEQIRREVNHLIVSISIELSTNATAENKNLFQTLIGLQTVLKSPQGISPENLYAIGQEVSRIKSSTQSNGPQHSRPSSYDVSHALPNGQMNSLAALLGQTPTPQHISPAFATSPSTSANYTAVSVPMHPQNGVANPSSEQLTSLLAALGQKVPQPVGTPVPSMPITAATNQAAVASATSSSHEASKLPPSTSGFDFFASLRSAGFVPTAPSAPRTITPVPPTIPASLAALAAPPLRLESTSLKVPRPHMLTKLYGERPDQCRQCGRRFYATEQGKKQKAAHLDWHFKTATRIADAANSIVNRSSYLGELAWIRHREPDPLDPERASVSNTSPTKNQAARDVVPVPKDGSAVNAVCPICQDHFEKVFSEELQAWVWTDAIQVGGKPWHKTCYDEVKSAGVRQDGGGNLAPATLNGLITKNAPARSTPTPDSVLGKRKHEDTT